MYLNVFFCVRFLYISCFRVLISRSAHADFDSLLEKYWLMSWSAQILAS